MEFPHLGEHCQEPSCRMLDFLPFKCGSCKKILCKDHIHMSKHKCNENSFQNKDFQVPLCPLCNQPVPYKRTELPDIVMSAHIDRDCQSDPAEERRRKIYSNRCSKKGCKQKELIPFECSKCRRNYCIRHRLETDHDCEQIISIRNASATNNNNSNNKQQSQRSITSYFNYDRLLNRPSTASNTAGPTAANNSRSSSSSLANTNAANYQNSVNNRVSNNSSATNPTRMTDSEQLEYAIRLSMLETNAATTASSPAPSSAATVSASNAAAAANRANSQPIRNNETDEDEILARVLEQSEREYAERQQQATRKDNSCSIH